MLNKELLLVPKKESGPEYTHELTIGANRRYIGYNALKGFGGVEPKSLLGEALLEVCSSPDEGHTVVTIDGFLGVSQLYIGRLDTEELIRLDNIAVTEGVARGPGVLFTSIDIDTIIPIYIGENPPLGLK